MLCRRHLSKNWCISVWIQSTVVEFFFSLFPGSTVLSSDTWERFTYDNIIPLPHLLHFLSLKSYPTNNLFLFFFFDFFPPTKLDSKFCGYTKKSWWILDDSHRNHCFYYLKFMVKNISVRKILKGENRKYEPDG